MSRKTAERASIIRLAARGFHLILAIAILASVEIVNRLVDFLDILNETLQPRNIP